ncbi:DUF6049 family protein [Microbacterium pumilum]|uniref:2-oxoglutarate dehydrogenase n=1 Tax=Microbacterium pumilum TaxID=344165 RepID=A0ABP5DBG4_9MICO
MTVTPPRARAVRRTLRARAVVAFGAAVIALLPVIGVVPGGTAPAGASTTTPTPTPTPTPDIPAGTTKFTLSPVGSGIVQPGDPLSVSVTLQNGTSSLTAPVEVTLRLGSSPLPDRAALAAWLAGRTGGIAAQQVGTAAIGSIPAGGERTEGIGVDGDDPAMQNRAPGVYPLAASYDGPDGVVTSTSVMVVPDPAAAPTQIGVIVPITADAIAGGLLTAAELTELTAPTGSLTSELNAVEGTSVILAVDPAIPAAIRVLGTSAPESALEWLERFDALPQSRFALQFGDADVAVQIKAGLSRPMQPTSLSAYMSPDDFIPVDSPTPTPEPTPTPTPTPTQTADADPDAPVYPDLESLLDIGGGRAGVFWPTAGAAGPDTVATLGDLTMEGQTSLTVIPSITTAQGAAGATVPAHGQSEGGGEVLVYDTDVSTALQQASVVDEAALRGAALTEATAYLAFAASDLRGTAPLLVTLDRDTARSRVGLRSAITTATEAPGAAPVTLGRLAAADPIDIQVADADIDASRVAAASALFSEETELSRFATILDDSSLLTGPERARILQLLAVAWIPDPVAWSAAVTAHRAATTVTLNSVDLLPTSTVNLFGSGADLGFWVRNDLPYPVNLILYATPDSLRLDVQRATPVVAGASSNTRVEVPVQARVGNGEVTLALQLRSRASVAIGNGAFVDVNVRAEWEGVGVIALSVVVGALLVLGIGRTVLRVRNRRRAAAAGTVAAGTVAAETADAAGAPDEPQAREEPDPAISATDDDSGVRT